MGDKEGRFGDRFRGGIVENFIRLRSLTPGPRDYLTTLLSVTLLSVSSLPRQKLSRSKTGSRTNTPTCFSLSLLSRWIKRRNGRLCFPPGVLRGSSKSCWSSRRNIGTPLPQIRFRRTGNSGRERFYGLLRGWQWSRRMAIKAMMCCMRSLIAQFWRSSYPQQRELFWRSC